MQRVRSKEWIEREALRNKGQFWTPGWVARAMARFVAPDHRKVFDAGVGAGAFALALKDVRPTLPLRDGYVGVEVDPPAIKQALANGLTQADLSNVSFEDFLKIASLGGATSIISNPPYIRHHRMTSRRKEELAALAQRDAGIQIDGRAGLHVYFLIHALKLLPSKGRLAFIVPADVVEGIFAKRLWEWIAGNFRIHACVRFEHTATPFPGVDTNPVVLLIERSSPQTEFFQVDCKVSGADAFERWIERMEECDSPELEAKRYSLKDGIERGLARRLDESLANCVPLSAFATTLRGVATGANEFFFLSDERKNDLKIPDKFFVRAIGKTSDVTGSIFNEEHLEELASRGRPTWLLNLDKDSLEAAPKALRSYVLWGEELGLSDRSLIKTRRPWFRMEKRLPPPFLFTYLGRRSARFVRNVAEVVPLTGFICVYGKSDNPDWLDRLWSVLSDPRTTLNLKHVAKSYGGGALKVEPRALAQLPIPVEVIGEYGLTLPVE